MTLAKSPRALRCALAVMMVAAVAASIACSGKAPAPAPSATTGSAAAEKPTVPLLAEDAVRLSNDPAKTEIFRDAGLGLFIHWGPNSQVGTEISWPLFNASDDYIRKYYGLAETFNPTEFDPAAWARLAKLAGMEYVVFTAKHLDGFCLFDTDYSDFKITRTPYGKDIAAMIAGAFRKEGLLVGFYYSPGDFRYQWTTGQRTGHIYEPGFASTALFGPKQKNFLGCERGHIEELLTRYGDIFMLWFDGKCEPLKKHAWRVRQDVFISRGEIPTPEQEIPGDLGLWMMLYGEAVRGVRPWSVTNEGDVWFTQKRAEGTVYALAVLQDNAKTLLLKSVSATPGTKVTLLSQEGELPWEQTPAGLKITVTRKQTIRLIKAKPAPGGREETSDIQRPVSYTHL